MILGIIASLLLPAFVAAACSDGGVDAPGDSTPLSVVATTVQIAALTKEVGGAQIELHGLIPAGADPHDFEPKPSDLQAIENADVILRHGLGLDDWLDGTLEAGNDATVVTVTDGIATTRSGDDVADPHVWLDPENAKIMVDAIARALDAADPASEVTYDRNASAYKHQLDETKAAVQAIIDEIPPDSRKLVTDHDAFGYFARAFGLEIVGAIFPVLSSQSQPSAQETADLLDTIRREHVKAVFAEQSVNSALAKTLADDAGVKIVDDLYGDSLGKPGSGAETVDGMLLTNAHKIADALR